MYSILESITFTEFLFWWFQLKFHKNQLYVWLEKCKKCKICLFSCRYTNMQTMGSNLKHAKFGQSFTHISHAISFAKLRTWTLWLKRYKVIKLPTEFVSWNYYNNIRTIKPQNMSCPQKLNLYIIRFQRIVYSEYYYTHF